MMIAILVLVSLSLSLSLILAGGYIAIWLKMRQIDRHLSKILKHLVLYSGNVAERLEQIDKIISSLADPTITQPKATWVQPKKEKPKVIRRTEQDEFEMEKPLGERKA